jgi:hypothetical protein
MASAHASVELNTQAPLTLPGTLSTAEQSNESSAASDATPPADVLTP